MGKKIKINCKGSRTVPLGELRPFQGELKLLSEANYIKLSSLIKSVGFSFPVFVWTDSEHNQTYILDGHQRIRTLKKLVEEGYEVDKIPVADVHADSYKQAKEKLLAAASYYGKVDEQGLYEFVIENDFDPTFLDENFDIPGIDLQTFNSNFFGEPEIAEESKEIDELETKTECPKCGYAW